MHYNRVLRFLGDKHFGLLVLSAIMHWPVLARKTVTVE
jgi:hypothetical protein